MAGRKRRLSPEERALWQGVAASTTPLHPYREVDEAPAAAPMPAPLPPSPPERPALPPLVRRVAAEPRTRLDLALEPALALAAAAPQMDRRRFDKLRRGRIEPEARLDLHGMTAERAYGALTRFVLGAHARELRLVLVITGKGRPDGAGFQPHRHGILRHSVPHWLTASPLVGAVLQIHPAHQRHGGAGAYYVYLRRRRGAD